MSTDIRFIIFLLFGAFGCLIGFVTAVVAIKDWVKSRSIFKTRSDLIPIILILCVTFSAIIAVICILITQH